MKSACVLQDEASISVEKLLIIGAIETMTACHRQTQRVDLTRAFRRGRKKCLEAKWETCLPMSAPFSVEFREVHAAVDTGVEDVLKRL